MKLNVNTESLTKSISTGEEYMKKIKSEMEGLFKCADELESMWDGSASEEFCKQIAKDKELSELILKDISEMLGSMQKSNKLYDSCETAVSSKIDKIKM